MMPSGAELFGGGGGTPPLPGGTPDAPQGASMTGAQLFAGGGNGGEDKATSTLASSRAALPQTSKEVSTAREDAGKPPAPTPEDVQRNLVDLKGHQSAADRTREILAGGKQKEGDMRFGSQADVSRESSERMGTSFALQEVASPVAGVRAAIQDFGKPLAKGLDAVTNRAFGVSLLDRFSTKLGDQASQLSDGLYQLGKAAQGMKMQWMTDVKNFLPKDWAEHAKDIYNSFEDPSIKLSPRAQALKDKTVAPIMAKNAKMREELRALGVNVGPEVENYIERVQMGQSSLVDTLRSNMPTGKPRGVSTFAPELQSRKVFEMEPAPSYNAEGAVTSKGSGEKDLHFVKNQNNTFTVYRNQQKIGGGKFTPEELDAKEVSFMGERYKLTTGTTENIMKHTQLQYYQDPLISAIQGNVNLSEALRNAKFLEQFKHSPEFVDAVTKVKPGAQAPDGFREVQIPQLKGYAFSNRVANVLEDFSGVNKNGWLDKVNDITRVTVSSLFWNPLPHIMNVLDHKVIEGGLIGNIKALTVDLPQTAKTALAAHREVVTMGPLYRQALKEGAGLIYPSVALRDFAGQMAQQLGTAPEMEGVSKAWGYLNPAKMIQSIYQHSAKSLWSWNDVIMMHAYMAHMAEGAELPAAIKSVEKHIPNYRVPDQVLGSRTLGQAMQSPGVTAFGRYDYGRLASYGNMAKDLLSRDSSVADKAKAADQLAMLAVSSFVVYPALDAAVRKVTGNDNATLRRFGAATVPEAVMKFAQGDTTWGMLMGTVLPLSPALKTPVELMTGFDTFTGKRIADEKGRYAAQQLAPVGQIYHSTFNPRKSATEVLAAQMGINLPTDAEVEARDRAKAREEKKRAKESEE